MSLVLAENAAASSSLRQLPARRGEAHQARDRTRPAHDRQVAVVERLEQHHLVARLDEAEEAARQHLGSAGGDHDLALPIDLEAVEALGVGGHRLAQLGHAEHGRVLIGSVLEEEGRLGAHVLGPVAVGEALAEIDRAVLDGEARHDLEYRGAGAREDAVGWLHGGSVVESTAI